MTTLIVGCGYLGRRVGRLLADRGEVAYGTARSAARLAELPSFGVRPVRLDVLDPSTLDALPEVDRVLYCVGFDRGAGVAMRDVYVGGLERVLDRLAGRVGQLLYASSTGVYGRDDGEWIDEQTPAEPRHESGRVCLEAEGIVRRFEVERGLPSVIVRYAGLYGPGRMIRKAALERGEPIIGDPTRHLNLIHIDDAAAVALAALDRGEPGSIYLAVDDRPVPRREYYERVAEWLGLAPPTFVPPEPGSPEANREEANKRVSNRRMRAELGVELAYPDIATGVPAALGVLPE